MLFKIIIVCVVDYGCYLIFVVCNVFFGVMIWEKNFGLSLYYCDGYVLFVGVDLDER